MTVCIAAICESGIPDMQKIIMCADRQVSTGLNNYESGVSKIMAINNYCYVMVSSNDSARTNMVLDKVANSISNKKLKIEEIVKLISKEFEELFKKEREKEVLSKFGLNYIEFSEKSKNMNPVLLKEISDYLIEFETSKSNVIIVGLDPAPHIYVIDEKGDYSFEEKSGFAVVGSGSYLAFPEMTRHEPPYNPQAILLPDALIRVYRAKFVAQRVGGVGPSTDLAVLHLVKGEVNLWEATNPLIPQSKDTLEILEETIAEVKKKETEILNEHIKKLTKVFEEVKVEKEISPKQTEVNSSSQEQSSPSQP